MTELTKPFLELADEAQQTLFFESYLGGTDSTNLIQAIRTLVTMFEKCREQRDRFAYNGNQYLNVRGWTPYKEDKELQNIAEER